jgi:hypothetical protein
MITVALPLFEMPIIAHLAIESLCNQKTECKWELIVMEEKKGEFGLQKLSEYKERLFKAGCISIRHYSLNKWKPLPQKWRDMAKLAAPGSKAFVLQAGDSYSPPERLQRVYEMIVKNGYHWYQQQQAVMYHIRTGQHILYNGNSPGYSGQTAFNMAADIELIKRLPESTLKRCIDNWMFQTIKKIKGHGFRIYKDNSDIYLTGFDAHGLNKISERNQFFNNPTTPFEKTTLRIDNIIDADLLSWIKWLK